jgi:hypothetical protein
MFVQDLPRIPRQRAHGTALRKPVCDCSIRGPIPHLPPVGGSIEIVFADYQIDPPSSFAVLSVDDHGVMELQLFLGRS